MATETTSIVGWLIETAAKHQYVVLAVLILTFEISYAYIHRDRKVDGVPVYGGTTLWQSWCTALRFVTHAPEMIGDCNKKYQNTVKMFQIPTLRGMQVFVCEGLVSEFAKAPKAVVSFNEATRRTLGAKFTFGSDVIDKDWHIPVSRQRLPTVLESFMPALCEEANLVLDETVDCHIKDDNWTAIKMNEPSKRVFAEISSRLFVGLPYCRNLRYLAASAHFTESIFVIVQATRFLPVIVGETVGRILGPLLCDRQLRIATDIIGPEVERRIQRADSGYKPDDLLQWLVEAAPQWDRNVPGIAKRLMVLNLGAIHTTHASFLNALYYLAANPDVYLVPLRDEVEQVVKEHGWTKHGLREMKKLDSFVKEAQRMDGFGAFTMNRRITQPFTFSNGITVPGGTYISVPIDVMRSENVWDNPEEFDGFRYSRQRERDGEVAKHSLVSTGPSFVHFGHGHHSCPGRFLAAHSIKTMLGLMIMRYDIKQSARPKEFHIEGNRLVDPHAEIFLRRRH